MQSRGWGCWLSFIISWMKLLQAARTIFWVLIFWWSSPARVTLQKPTLIAWKEVLILLENILFEVFLCALGQMLMCNLTPLICCLKLFSHPMLLQVNNFVLNLPCSYSSTPSSSSSMTSTPRFSAQVSLNNKTNDFTKNKKAKKSVQITNFLITHFFGLD